MNKEEKFLGCMYGLAIGDALGFPVEFMDLREIKKKFGENGIDDLVSREHSKGKKLPLGSYSDDTQMSLAVANGLIDSPEPLDLDETMENITKEFIKWLNEADPRFPGRTCVRGALKLHNGVSWEYSGNPNSKGCGAAMRNAPIGLFYSDKLDKLVEIAVAGSAATHAHPTGIASGVGTAYLTYLAYQHVEPEEMIEKVCDIVKKIDTKGEFRQKLRQIKEVWDLPNEEAIKILGQGWIGEEAVAIALYSFLKSPEDYKKTILTAANITGDSDSTACIAGAISGAYNGIGAIPKEWIEKVENSALIEKTAKKLCEKSDMISCLSESESAPWWRVYSFLTIDLIDATKKRLSLNDTNVFQVPEKEELRLYQGPNRFYKTYGAVDIVNVRKKVEGLRVKEDIGDKIFALSYDEKKGDIEISVFKPELMDLAEAHAEKVKDTDHFNRVKIKKQF